MGSTEKGTPLSVDSQNILQILGNKTCGVSSIGDRVMRINLINPDAGSPASFIVKSPSHVAAHKMEKRIYQEAMTQQTTSVPNLLLVTKDDVPISMESGEEAIIPPDSIFIEDATKSLFDLIPSIVEMSLGRKIAMAMSLIKAIENFHNMGYIHRDLKAENICCDLETMLLKIIDFEFCVPIGSRGIHKGIKGENVFYYAGSALYMPPECLKNECIYDEAYDMYMTGIIILQVFGGSIYLSDLHERKKKFMPNHTRLRYELAHREFQMPTNLPPDIERVLNGCLNSEPEKRLSYKEVKETFEVIVDAMSGTKV